LVVAFKRSRRKEMKRFIAIVALVAGSLAAQLLGGSVADASCTFIMSGDSIVDGACVDDGVDQIYEVRVFG
jgi:hypothetical protein